MDRYGIGPASVTVHVFIPFWFNDHKMKGWMDADGETIQVSPMFGTPSPSAIAVRLKREEWEAHVRNPQELAELYALSAEQKARLAQAPKDYLTSSE